MDWQPDVRGCSTGLCVVCLLHNVLVNTVESSESQFILPSLPATPYSLNDVILLPENRDFVETTILTETGLILGTVNVTHENGFRLGNVSWSLNESTGSGLKISTPNKVTVVLQLPSGLLHLPSISDYANDYYTFTIEESLEETQERNLFIQSISLNTLVSLCFRNYEEEKITHEFIQYSNDNHATHKCTTKNISGYEILLFNYSSMLHGIEITSDHPVGILEGRRTHLSSVVKNGRDFNTSKTLGSPISWHIVPPYSDWNNQFLLIPSQGRRQVKLWIMSLENTSVDIVSDEYSIPITLIANLPCNINVTADGTILVAGNDRLSLSCQDLNAVSCNEDIFPVIDVGLNYTTSNNVENEGKRYQWIYVFKNTAVIVICPTFLNVGLYSSNGSAELAQEITFKIGSQTLVIKQFKSALDGLYKVLTNSSLHLCSVFYSNRERALYSNINFSTESNISKQTNLLTKTLRMSNVEPTVSTNTVELQNISASFSSLDIPINTTKYETLTLKSEHVTVTPEMKPRDTVFATQNSNGKLNDKRNKENVSAVKSDPNDRFKAVVDILHSSNGSVNTIISQIKQSNTRNNPTYIYKSDLNYRDEHGDGKSPLAVIVSLVSALLAVGAIILVFLLKEIFSRRQQIRNTRIRPFISYY